MNREILLDSLLGQRRLAVYEDGELCELYIERDGSESISGNIYAGHVENVLPGMNAAFVNIGLPKNAFLYAGDIQIDTRGDAELANRLKEVSIKKLVRPGQQILVQVVKQSGGAKGPRVSSHITLPGRLMVLLPTMRYVGVSRKITQSDERSRLRALAEQLLDAHGCGMIVRTAAEHMDEETLAAEYESLRQTWQDVLAQGNVIQAPALVHGENDLVSRALRDMLNGDTSAVVTDDDALYRALLDRARTCAPAFLDRIRLHTANIPLFDVRGVDAALSKALNRKVWLKSGGYLIIDYTEALTVIDVNTGKFVGKSSLSDTIFKTNCEAAREIARQLRLRDIGGIIIVDFIDMDAQEQRDQLLALLREAIARDRTSTNFAGFTALGLVELTRKKTRQPLHRLIMRACPTCGGAGIVENAESAARRALGELRRKHAESPDQPYLIHAAKHVAGKLIEIGAPPGVRAHILPNDQNDCAYKIEALDQTALPEGTKPLIERKQMGDTR
ncbi:MAG: Rne/Rng family ribonuclease [Christensenellales bacterium]|jgi:ribonuclease G